MTLIEEAIGTAKWELSGPEASSVFTSDDVLDAFDNGKKAGVSDFQNLAFSKLKENVNRCGKLTEDIYSKLKSLNIDPVSGFLKIESFDTFQILVTVSEDDFLSEKIIKATEYVGLIEDKEKDDFFDLSIIFTINDENLDFSCIRADGFSLKYTGKKKKNEKSSR